MMDAKSLTTMDILRRTVSVMRDNIQMALTALVVITGIAMAGEMVPVEAVAATTLASAAASVYFQTVVTKTALTRSAMFIPDGRPTGSFGSVFLIGIITSLGILAGMLLLIIPGLIFAARWSVAVPITLSSDHGVSGSLSKSSEIAKPHTVAIIGALLVVILPLIAAIGVTIVDEINTTATSENMIVVVLIQTAISVSTILLWYMAIAIYELASGAADTLSEIFA